ncbi:TerC family protein [bacterium LRH843]|nr:TerC family protein [bacterium LRH843]
MDTDFILSLFSIIGIDIVLGGDNAIVIALACRGLPKEIRNRAIFLGLGLAIIIRVLLTIVAVQLLEIPFLLAVGGALLIYIAFSLLTDNAEEHSINGGTNIISAIKAIVLADLVMGFDNVIAVAGAANGESILVIFGLLVSVPIIIWGSRLILNAFERFPIIIYIGAGILAYTASRMIIHEEMLAPLFIQYPHFTICFQIAIVVIVIVGGSYRKKFS